MATRKKAKSKAQRKKAPVRKPATRKTAARAKKKVPAKKTTARRVAAKKRPAARVAPKKTPAPRPAPARKARPVSPSPRPAEPPAPAAAPAPLAGEERVGIVIHYFSHISVAIVRLESDSLRLGDAIHITGHTSDFRQRIESLQVEHQPVPEVSVGQEFGLKVTAHARENDIVYKVTAPQP